MRDYNFFEPYIKKSRKIDKNKIILLCLLGIMIISATTYPIMITLRTIKINNSIAAMKTEMLSDETKQNNSEITVLQRKIQEREQQLQFLGEIDDIMKDVDLIDEYLIYTVSSAVPEGIFLNTVNISSSDIKMTGTSLEKTLIAELQYNLRQCDTFEEIFIPSITFDNGYYDFSVIISFVGVKNDEDD